MVLPIFAFVHGIGIKTGRLALRRAFLFYEALEIPPPYSLLGQSVIHVQIIFWNLRRVSSGKMASTNILNFVYAS